jgi:hypothetical protein
MDAPCCGIARALKYAAEMSQSGNTVVRLHHSAPHISLIRLAAGAFTLTKIPE